MKVVDDVLNEVKKATAKFPTWPTDPLHAIAVLGEEFGELTKATLQFTYEPHKTSLEEIREEAIQTAAMALRFAMSLDKYTYSKCEQHKQSDDGRAFKFKIGDILRYSGGSTALMRVKSVSPNHGGFDNRYYGEQFYGGSVGAYESDCSLATDEERIKFETDNHLSRLSGVASVEKSGR